MITPGHKRELNRALHELRRPLQALVLLEDAAGRPTAAPPISSRRGLLELVATALSDLDGALNGGALPSTSRRFSCRDSVLASVERWRPAAAGSHELRVYWDAGPAMVDGDPVRMAQALDNLLANALEHGGSTIVVTGAEVAGRLRVTIANGAGKPRMSSAGDPRRGHGTELVSRVASSHGGRFALCRTGSGCVAAIEIPLAEPGYARVA